MYGDIQTKSFTEEDGVFKADVVLTKQVKDREGEVLMVDGCNLDDYKNNPIVLWDHATFRMEKATQDDVVGRMDNVRKDIGGDGIPQIVGTVVFAEHDGGQKTAMLVKNGAISRTYKDFSF